LLAAEARTLYDLDGLWGELEKDGAPRLGARNEVPRRSKQSPSRDPPAERALNSPEAPM
jgi:hypothetical protein